MISDDIGYVPSPCVRHCTLNEDDICIGCGRSLEEIKAWGVSDVKTQKDIIAKSEKRLIQMKHQGGS